MIYSQVREKHWLESPPNSQKIVNVPLPSQQAAKILKDLQVSCNSPNKAVQIEALKCWGTWINNHSHDEWNLDGTCHFAVKPLCTKKIHSSHKDADVCKLKLNLMWELLSKVQNKMELGGAQHILECFIQSCFTWLASIDSLDVKVILLILKLLFKLFRPHNSSLECDNYIFLPLQIDCSVLQKLFLSYSNQFMDLFENWKKINDNNLIISLWKCFLENCESSHKLITTSIWHKIFKVNHAFCSDRSEPLIDRLAFLQLCATKVKTVLLSSKYIGGESCFVTPCEALIKKFIEVCSTENEKPPDSKAFFLSEDITKVLSHQSISACDYDLCIQLCDALEDFHHKALLWGTWCGLVDFFKKELRNIERNEYNRKQNKFYRKIRGVVVNFEFDLHYLNEECIAKVRSNIEVLNINCLCYLKLPETYEKGAIEVEQLGDDSKETLKSSTLVSCQSRNLVSVEEISQPQTTDLIEIRKPYLNVVKNFGSGKFGFVTNSSAKPKLIVKIDDNLAKSIFNCLDKSIIKTLFKCFVFTRFPNRISVYSSTPKTFLERSTLPAIKGTVSLSSEKTCDPPINVVQPVKTFRKTSLQKALPKTPPRRTRSSLALDKQKTESEEITRTPTTRSKTRVEEQGKTRDKEVVQSNKKRKSFEIKVQEIVDKNKRRKTEKKDKLDLTSTNSRILRRKGKKESPSPITQKNERLSEKIKEASFETKKKKEETVKSNSSDGKIENFFTVINPKEHLKQTKSRRSLKNSKNSITDTEKEKKNEINWKQTSIKNLMSPTVMDSEKLEQDLHLDLNKNPELVEGTVVNDTETASPRLQHHEASAVLHQPNNKNAKNTYSLGGSPMPKSTPVRLRSTLRPRKQCSLIKRRSYSGKDEPEEKEYVLGAVKEVDEEILMENATPVEELALSGCATLKQKEDFKAEFRACSLSAQFEVTIAKENTNKISELSNEKLVVVREPTQKIDSELMCEGENRIVEPCYSQNEIYEKKVETITEELIANNNEVILGKRRLVECENELTNKKIKLKEESTKDCVGGRKEESTGERIGSKEESTGDCSGSKKEESTEDCIGCREEESTENGISSRKEDTAGDCSSSKKEESTEDCIGCREEESTENGISSRKEESAGDCIITGEGEKENSSKITNEDDTSTENTCSPPRIMTTPPNNKASPPEHSKLLITPNRLSSRALRMIALVPEGHQTSPKSTPKMDIKVLNKKCFSGGVDKSSRVSKMLANLSKSGPVEVEDCDENKPRSDGVFLWSATVTTPKSSKKRKFISFDDSKNQTIIYQVDTPPSAIFGWQSTTVQVVENDTIVD